MNLKDLRKTGSFNDANLVTNLEIQRYYQNEPRFNGIYSRNNLPDKIKYGVYLISLDEYADIGNS